MSKWLRDIEAALRIVRIAQLDCAGHSSFGYRTNDRIEQYLLKYIAEYFSEHGGCPHEDSSCNCKRCPSCGVIMDSKSPLSYLGLSEDQCWRCFRGSDSEEVEEIELEAK